MEESESSESFNDEITDIPKEIKVIGNEVYENCWFKKSGMSWKKSWYLFSKNKRIYYYENENKATIRGEINLFQAKLASPCDFGNNNEKFGFQIETKGKTHKIYVESEELRNDIVSMINNEIKLIQIQDTYISRVITSLLASLRNEPNRNIQITPLDFYHSVIHHLKKPFSVKIDIEEYYPKVFANIRDMNKVPIKYLVDEWTLPQESFLSEGSAGKSGSMFILSNERYFMVKSIEKREKNLFIRMIQDYHDHLTRYPESLLMKIYGFYRYKTSVGNQSFIMFNNFLKLNLSIDEKYDLKGSTKDREANSKEKAKAVPILLDLDFLATKKTLKFGEVAKEKFMKQLKEDALLLSRHNAMDYSLLIGIHKITEEDEETWEAGSMNFTTPAGNGVCTIISSDGEEIYFVGIIDCLTDYDVEKIIAHNAKRLHYSSAELSTVNAKFYCERFCNFVDSIIL